MSTNKFRELCSGNGSVKSYIAQNDDSTWVSSRDDEEVDIYIQNDGPTPYQVVQVGTAQTDQPGKERMT